VATFDMNRHRFVVATPTRSVCDDYARALEKEHLLRFIAIGTRRGAADIPSEQTRLNPWVGLAAYAAARTMSTFQAESFRFRLLPWFDRWVEGQLQAGDHIISSYGYTNKCFRWVRRHGGKTFIDAGNSHPANFWEILLEEHTRWHSKYPPVARHWIDRSLAMMDDIDYVLSPSTYVTESFLKRGFQSEQVLPTVYTIDPDCFAPSSQSRPASRPLTLISTGMLSLRKGTPYLLEAYRIVRGKIPDARLLLTRQIQNNVRPILRKYSDLPIEWAPSLPHRQLADQLRSADIFILPSLEEGLARTGIEALVCGLPAIVTQNTGVNDWIVSEANGQVVPIRDARAIAEAVFTWRDKVFSPSWEPQHLLDIRQFSFEHFAQAFVHQLKAIGLAE
jgi:glycosyltransferase involved in cell wall biosynthesis